MNFIVMVRKTEVSIIIIDLSETTEMEPNIKLISWKVAPRTGNISMDLQ
jgi:hypothetical protein